MRCRLPCRGRRDWRVGARVDELLALGRGDVPVEGVEYVAGLFVIECLLEQLDVARVDEFDVAVRSLGFLRVLERSVGVPEPRGGDDAGADADHGCAEPGDDDACCRNELTVAVLDSVPFDDPGHFDDGPDEGTAEDGGANDGDRPLPWGQLALGLVHARIMMRRPAGGEGSSSTSGDARPASLPSASPSVRPAVFRSRPKAVADRPRR